MLLSEEVDVIFGPICSPGKLTAGDITDKMQNLPLQINGNDDGNLKIKQRMDYKILSLTYRVQSTPPLNLHIYIILSLFIPIVALVFQMS